jgi:methionine aminopeptidase
MTKDAFKDRERGLEEEFFRKEDAKRLEKMRETAKLQEIAGALAEVLKVKNPDLLSRAISLGIHSDTAAAFLLAPLVQVAWAEGKVTEPEREAILRFALFRGVEKGSPAEAQLLAWLQARPAQAVFDTAIEVIKAGLAEFPPNEREDRIAKMIQACREVSEASGGIAKALGVGSGVSTEEQSVLDAVTKALRSE